MIHKPFGFIASKTPSIPRNGLIGEWLFSNNLLDTSGNGYNFTNNNTTFTTDRKTETNSAVYFNGSDAYCYVANFENIITSDWSLSFWIRPDGDIANNKTFISYGDITQTSKYFSFRRFSNNLYYSATWDSTLSIPASTWTHFVITYSYNDLDLYVYKNDSESNSNLNLSLGSSSTLNFMLGAFISPITGLFKGSMDDFRVYNRVLTSNDITALYNE